MYIIIAGCGKVGFTIAKHLSSGENDVLIIDKKNEVFDRVTETVDAMVLKGNCLSVKVLEEAQIQRCDLLICVTSSDEANILCCLTGKKLGAKHSIARVRDPEYAVELLSFKKDLGLDMVINPEYQTALEISRLLRFPSADDIETFVSGRVEIASFTVEKNDFFDHEILADISQKLKLDILVCLVNRDNEAIIPNGDFVFLEGDTVRVLGTPAEISEFFRTTGKFIAKIKNVLVIGGGKITFYLAELLSKMSMNIKIIEINREQASLVEEKLSDIRGLSVIQGDGSDEELLMSEGMSTTDAIICLTDRDEENVIIGLYAISQDVPKVIVKTSHVNTALTNYIGLRSTVSPRNITAYQILRYIRTLTGSLESSNIQTMYKIFYDDENSVEALEFNVCKTAKCISTPLKKLPIRKGTLIGCIVRGSRIIIPKGDTSISQNDTVIIISKNSNYDDIDDILL